MGQTSLAQIYKAQISGANLEGAKFYGSHLGGVVFDKARLSSARLAFAKVDIAIILAKSLKNADLTGVRFVLEDEDGRNDLSMFNDTIAEAPSADEGQRRINQACANPKFGAPQNQFFCQLSCRCDLAVILRTIKAFDSKPMNILVARGLLSLLVLSFQIQKTCAV